MSTKEEKNEGKLAKKPIFPTGGIFLIVLGVIFLLNNYGFSYIDIGKLWPVILIIVGLGVVLNNKKR